MRFGPKISIYSIAIFLSLLFSCSSEENELSIENEIESLEAGTAFFRYVYDESSQEKEIKIYYHIPENIDSSARILFTFHGNGRNARDYRNSLIEQSDQYKFIVIVPEFSIDNFPGGDGYNLGNVFIDGDNPTPQSLNPESEWAFSIIEPLFDDLKFQIGNTSSTFDVYGHSAGGQFAHRLLMFKPDLRVDQIIASASGWYTFPNQVVAFPYGFTESPLQDSSLEPLFAHKLTILIGGSDDNPNASGLRRNNQVDLQGTHRKERAKNFFEFSQNLALTNNFNFKWTFEINENADHNFILASEKAADLLYQ